MKKIFAALISVIFIGSALIFFTYDPQVIQKSTVKDILENSVALDKKDVKVTLFGTIPSQISKKKFWFEDKTGQIVIEVKNDLIPLVPNSNQIEVEIKGKVDCQTNAENGVKINVDELILDESDEDLFSM
ncbi:MAG: NirD/YgiW/YdeI family stress tolerance protein [Bacteroidales bacterium]|nr:NirD/YgiW/YdeI family stress tolerance protein [Bacteroidales bacterium]